MATATDDSILSMEPARIQTEDKVTGNVKLDEDTMTELREQLWRYRAHAIGYHEGTLGVRARMAWEYYYGNLPEPVTTGASSWVDRSVWESVNGTLQELISVFTSGEKAVRFAPAHAQDGFAAIAATEMVNKALLVDNPGYNVLHDTFKECLVTRNSFVKRYWGKKRHVMSEEFSDMTKEELDIFLSQIDGDIIEFTSELHEEEQGSDDQQQDPMEAAEEKAVPPEVKDRRKKKKEIIEAVLKIDTGENQPQNPQKVEKYYGKVVYECVKEGVIVEYVPFEEMIIEPTARSLKEANYIAHRVRKTKDDLLLMGFDPEVVNDIHGTSSDIQQGTIANTRVNWMNPLNVSDVVYTGDEKADKLWLHENYIKSSLANGEVEILQVFTVHDQILEINRVNEFPFETFTPFPVPGSIWGESVFDITKDVQDLNTTLIRGMIDNVMNANFRRYEAVKGQYDRESLLNNRPGGVIEVMATGSVNPFPYHPLPQGIDGLLEYINSKKEERTGVSKVGQGLDPNVFKNDNAAATVNMVMTAAQNRLRMVARNIAQRGMSDLMLSIYELIRMNGKKPIAVDTANGTVVIDPAKLPRRSEMVVNVAVGAGERRERAAALQALLMSLTQVPQLQQFMQPNNAYFLAQQLFETMGIYDTENFLTPLDKIPPQQPDPMQMAQLTLMQKQAQQLDVGNQKTVNEVQLNNKRFEFEQQKAADDHFIRKQESASNQDMNADKMSLEQQRVQLEHLRIQLQQQELQMKQQEQMIEAQIEARQNRPVSLGG